MIPHKTCLYLQRHARAGRNIKASGANIRIPQLISALLRIVFLFLIQMRLIHSRAKMYLRQCEAPEASTFLVPAPKLLDGVFASEIDIFGGTCARCLRLEGQGGLRGIKSEIGAFPATTFYPLVSLEFVTGRIRRSGRFL